MAWRRASLQHAYSFSQLDANTGSFSGVTLVSIRIWRFWNVGLTVSAISIFCIMKQAPWTLLDYDNNNCIIYLPHFPQLWIKVCSNALYSNDSERNILNKLPKPWKETQLAKTISWSFTKQDRLDIWTSSQGGILHAKPWLPDHWARAPPPYLMSFTIQFITLKLNNLNPRVLSFLSPGARGRERPWKTLVTCIPESGRWQNITEGGAGKSGVMVRVFSPSPYVMFCHLPDCGRHVTSDFQGLSLSLALDGKERTLGTRLEVEHNFSITYISQL